MLIEVFECYSADTFPLPPALFRSAAFLSGPSCVRDDKWLERDNTRSLREKLRDDGRGDAHSLAETGARFGNSLFRTRQLDYFHPGQATRFSNLAAFAPRMAFLT